MRRLFVRGAVVLALCAVSAMGARAADQTATKIQAPVFDIDDTTYIVGEEYAANLFVFKMAFRLSSMAFDANTTAGAIRWSFSNPDKALLLNGAKPVDPLVDNLVDPPRECRIDLNSDPCDPGSCPVVAIRNNKYSPISVGGGRGPYPEPGKDDGSKVTSETTTIILYASNGTTVTASRPLTIITWNNHESSIPGRDYTMTKIDFRKIVDDHFWFYKWGGLAAKTNNAMGMSGRRVSNDDGSWVCRYAGFRTPFIMDNVTEIRGKVTTTNMEAFKTPTWMVVFKNFSTDGQHGQNEYGGETIFVDNEGGANSPVAGVGRYEFRAYLMPTQMRTPQFSNSTYGFNNLPDMMNREFSLSWRLMGMPGSPKSATPADITVQNIRIWNHPIGNMVTDELTYSVNKFVDAAVNPSSPSAWGLDVSGQGSKAKFNSDGSVTISPATDWTSGTLTMFRPGDNKIDLTKTPPNYLDNYPIKWVPDQLYYIEFLLSAPTVSSEVNGPDVIRVGADTLTGELVTDNFAVPNTPDMSGGVRPKMIRGISLPRYATPQKYCCFFYTHGKTKTQIPDGARWRPRLEILTSKALQPMGRKELEGITVHAVTVKKVHFTPTLN
ncbi:hypothetical protein LLG95_18170 [bacterium]|nr:hypothetical protein [bacterium]